MDGLYSQTLQRALKAEIARGLPGAEAQRQLAPAERSLDYPTGQAPKQAAVLVLLFPDKEGHWQVLLIQRAAYQGVHSRQISFPGGQFENGDRHLTATALREAEEETGLISRDLHSIEWLSSLYIPPSHFQVYPLLGYMDHPPALAPDPHEVEALLTMPLKPFLKGDCLITGPITQSNGQVITSPYFLVEGYCIWGATAMILNELLVLINRQNLF